MRSLAERIIERAARRKENERNNLTYGPDETNARVTSEFNEELEDDANGDGDGSGSEAGTGTPGADGGQNTDGAAAAAAAQWKANA